LVAIIADVTVMLFHEIPVAEALISIIFPLCAIVTPEPPVSVILLLQTAVAATPGAVQIYNIPSVLSQHN
jgi:uncharacterized membrane protein YgaE (UPF0421/DUF939 family)